MDLWRGVNDTGQMPSESRKIGIAGPPIETPFGWLLLYHGITVKDSYYNIEPLC